MCEKANNDDCELVYDLQLDVERLQSEKQDIEDYQRSIIYRKNREVDDLQYRILSLEREKDKLQYRVNSLESDNYALRNEVNSLKNNHFYGGYR